MANRTFRVLVAAATVVLLAACQSSTTGTAQVGAGVPSTPQSTETTEPSTADTDSTSTDSTSVPVVPPPTSTATSTASSTATSAPTSTPAPSTSAPTTSAPTTSATAPKTTAPPPGSGDTFPDCVYGDWIASNEWFASAVAQLSGGAAHYISGDVLVTFKPDGTVRTHYRTWTNEFVVGDVTMTVVRNGKDTANYTVEEDGAFTMQDVKLSSKLTMTGHSPHGTVSMGNPDPEPVSTTGTFLCIDQLLYVQTSDGEMVLGRPELAEGS